MKNSTGEMSRWKKLVESAMTPIPQQVISNTRPMGHDMGQVGVQELEPECGCQEFDCKTCFPDGHCDDGDVMVDQCSDGFADGEIVLRLGEDGMGYNMTNDSSLELVDLTTDSLTLASYDEDGSSNEFVLKIEDIVYSDDGEEIYFKLIDEQGNEFDYDRLPPSAQKASMVLATKLYDAEAKASDETDHDMRLSESEQADLNWLRSMLK